MILRKYVKLAGVDWQPHPPQRQTGSSCRAGRQGAGTWWPATRCGAVKIPYGGVRDASGIPRADDAAGRVDP